MISTTALCPGHVGERQKGLARDLRAAGVITESILSRVQQAKTVIGESL